MNLMNKAPKEIDKEIKHWDVLLFKKLFSKSLDAYSGGYPFSISGDIRSVPS